jgi:hypothetical protein
VKHHPNHDPFEEVKFVSPFVSPEHSCEIECSSSPSLEPKPCPFGHPNVFLSSGQDSTNAPLEIENFCAMDSPIALTLENKERNSTYKHESFAFETP